MHRRPRTGPRDAPYDRPDTAQDRSASPASLAAAGVWRVAIIAGLGIRAYLFIAGFTPLNSDEAIVGLQSREIAAGHLAAFYPGQNYGGTAEATLGAAVDRVFGFHAWSGALAELLFSLLTLGLFHACARRLLDADGARVATAAFWLGDAWLAWFSFHDGGFYQSGLCFALAALLCLDTASRRAPWRWLLAAGMFIGLALWSTPLSAVLVLPGALIMGWRRGRAATALVGGAAIGSAPWWGDVLRGAPKTNTQYPLSGQPDIVGRLLHSMTELTFGGLRDYAPVIRPPAWATSVAALAVVALALILLIRGLRANNWLLIGLTASLLLWPLIVVGSGAYLSTQTLRYAYFEWPAICALIGYGFTVAGDVAGNAAGNAGFFRTRLTAVPRLAPAGVAVLLLAIMIANLSSATSGWQRSTVGVRQPALVSLGHYLVAHHMTDVYADYWVSYALDLDDPRVRAAALSEVRLPQYTRLAQSAARTTAVVYPGETDADVLDTLIGKDGGTRTLVAGFDVYSFPTHLDLVTAAGWTPY